MQRGRAILKNVTKIANAVLCHPSMSGLSRLEKQVGTCPEVSLVVMICFTQLNEIFHKVSQKSVIIIFIFKELKTFAIPTFYILACDSYFHIQSPRPVDFKSKYTCAMCNVRVVLIHLLERCGNNNDFHMIQNYIFLHLIPHHFS